MARKIKVSRDVSGQLRFAGKEKQPKRQLPTKRQMIRNASRIAFRLFKFDGAHPELHEANRELLSLCNKFINAPQEERSAKDAWQIIQGLKELRRKIKEKDQLKFKFPEN